MLKERIDRRCLTSARRPPLAGLSALRREGRIRPESVRLLFLGDGHWFQGTSVEQVAAEMGLQEVVEFLDEVTPEQADRLQRDADALAAFGGLAEESLDMPDSTGITADGHQSRMMAARRERP